VKERDDILFDLERIQDAIEANNMEGLQYILEDVHPTDIAQFLNILPHKHQQIIVNLLPVEVISEAISEMDPEAKPQRLLEGLSPELIGGIIEELSDDDAVDLLGELSPEKREKILQTLDEEDATDIRRLLTYPEDSAGGLTTEVISVHFSLTKKAALQEVINQSEEMGEFYAIYVIDDAERLIGTLSLKDLIKASPSIKIEDIMNEEVVYVEAKTDQEEVAKMLSQYNLAGIPVVDENMILLGRVTFDDVLDVIEEENTEDILKISGVSVDESLSGSWKDAVKYRFPWILINLCTASLASIVVLWFEPTIQNLSILAVFMPIIAGLGGNAGTQALAVTIRRLSLSTLPDDKVLGTVSKELKVGLVNGMFVGLVVSLIAWLSNSNPELGLVVFLAMTGNFAIAGLAGSSVPVILERLGFDPAVASSIFITALTDIIGFLLLLGLASYFIL
jgi:magnesium transporter